MEINLVPPISLILPAAKAGLKGGSVANEIVKEKFGYDFLGLVIKIGVFFAVAFAIQIYIKGKIEVDKIVRNPAQATPIFFGIAGIVFNFLFTEYQKRADNGDIPEPSQLFGNEIIVKLFSDEGYHGFKYWDMIKLIAGLLILMEWNQFRQMTKATGGQVAPLTHGVFLLLILGIGLTAVPDLIKSLRKQNFGQEALV